MSERYVAADEDDVRRTFNEIGETIRGKRSAGAPPAAALKMTEHARALGADDDRGRDVDRRAVAREPHAMTTAEIEAREIERLRREIAEPICFGQLSEAPSSPSISRRVTAATSFDRSIVDPRRRQARSDVEDHSLFLMPPLSMGRGGISD